MIVIMKIIKTFEIQLFNSSLLVLCVFEILISNVKFNMLMTFYIHYILYLFILVLFKLIISCTGINRNRSKIIKNKL